MDFSIAAKREEFRSYLENTGILDAIVETLVRPLLKLTIMFGEIW